MKRIHSHETHLALIELCNTSSAVPGSFPPSSAVNSGCCSISSHLLLSISTLSRQGRTKPALKPVSFFFFLSWRIGRVNYIVLVPPRLGAVRRRIDSRFLVPSFSLSFFLFFISTSKFLSFIIESPLLLLLPFFLLCRSCSCLG